VWPLYIHVRMSHIIYLKLSITRVSNGWINSSPSFYCLSITWHHNLCRWSWSYGSWIYNYLCNQCLSPPMLWVQIPLMVRCSRYNIMWLNLSVTCGRSVVLSGYSGYLHDITEILLKVALNTWTPTPIFPHHAHIFWRNFLFDFFAPARYFRYIFLFIWNEHNNKVWYLY
jgi:hypothetical protein